MPLFALLPLAGWTWLARRLTGSALGPGLLIAISAWLLVAFLGGLAGQLWLTTRAIWVLGAGLGVLALLEWARTRPLTVPIGIVLAGASLLAFWALHGRSQFLYFDEYGHWGVFLRDLWATHAYWGPDSNALHPRYPPGTPLWQYAFTVFAPQRDSSAYLAQFVLLLAPVAVLWSKLSWRQWPWAVFALAVAVIGLSNFGHGIASLYVDHVLGAWLAGTVLAYLLERPTGWRLAAYALPLVTMTLIKDVGIAFALGAAACMAIAYGWQRWRIERRLPQALLAVLAAGILLPLPAGLALVGWSLERDASGIATETQSLRGVAQGVLSGEVRGDAAQREGITTVFREVFLNQQLSKDATSAGFNEFTTPITGLFTDPWRISTAGFYLAFVIWMAVAVGLARHHRVAWGSTAVILAATALAYSGVLFASYLFAFGDRGILLPSYLRYTHTAVLALLWVAAGVLMPQFGVYGASGARAARRLVPAGLAGVLVAWLLILETPYPASFMRSNPVLPQRAQGDALMAEVRAAVGQRRLWIWFPKDQPNGFIGRLMQFQLAPTPTTVERDEGFFEQPEDAMRAALASYDVLWMPLADASTLQAVATALGGTDPGPFLEQKTTADGRIVFEAMAYD